MNESTDTRTEPGTPVPQRPPLRRSLSDRKIAGLAGGLGRYFNVDPLIFRVVLVTLAIFGGSGLLLYAVGWLLIPDDGEDESEGSRLISGRGTSKVIGAVILAVVGLIAVGNFAHTGFGFGGFAVLIAIGAAAYLISRGDTGWRPNRPPADAAPAQPAAHGPAPAAYGPAPAASYGAAAVGDYGQTPGTAYRPAPTTAPAAPPWTPPPPKPREPRSPLGRITASLALVVAGALVSWNLATTRDVPAEVVLATCLGVVALGLVTGAFVGRARGLIALGIVLTIATSIAGVSENGIRGGFGNRTWTPTSAAQIDKHGTYRLGAGNARLDLRGLEAPTGAPVTVTVRQGVGDLLVIVPAGAEVDIDARVRAGAIRLPHGRYIDGTDLHRRVTDVPTTTVQSPVSIDIDARLGVGELEVRRATS